MSLIVFEDLPSTNTPINATNLNNNFEKNVITLCLGGGGYIIQESSTYETLPMQLYNSTGTKLTAEGNAVKIGSGVSKVLISFMVLNDGTGGAGRKYAQIKKNGVYVNPTMTYSTGNAVQIIQTPLIIEVQENDVITMVVYGLRNDELYGYRTFLTVEVIE